MRYSIPIAKWNAIARSANSCCLLLAFGGDGNIIADPLSFQRYEYCSGCLLLVFSFRQFGGNDKCEVFHSIFMCRV